MTNWPVLPVEGPRTDVERSFIENSPPDLWPDNQDSNFGQIRRVITDPLQECVNFISQLYLELFVATSTIYLDLWEELAGVPTDPPLSLAARRAVVSTILKKGPFTRARRQSIVEAYLIAGFGEPIKLVPEGVGFDAAGLPIFGESDPTSPLYMIVENVEDFSYSVRIRSGTIVDDVRMLSALNYFQPAGLTVTLDYVVAPNVPMTPIRDTFNRADENPLVKTVNAINQWGGSIDGSANRLKVLTNRVQAAAAGGSAYWNQHVFAADQEVFITNVSNTAIQLVLRLTSPGASRNSYRLTLKGGANTTVDVHKIVAGVATLLGSPTVTGYATNDQWVFRAVGTSLKVYRNGLLEATINDSAITGGGQIGMYVTGTAVNADDFGGGNVT